ncbi:MAG: adenosylcobinamide-GDP ribazoletransferase [Flavihumibacter sp.]|nr:adenosylcobinamide-GDP ribazoletransferase [Flavihumibacter sp.]
MKKQLHIFFTAVMFYTRIPCPAWVNHDAEYLNKATRYFPLIGWLVGGAAAALFILCHYLFTTPVAILISMVGSILITGAFHEDGFADVCDGFGGGWTKEKILLIMKDSRVGAYGVIGTVLLLLLKFTSLTAIDTALLWKVLIAAHSFSRLCPVLMIATSRYVRENEDAKAKPLAKSITAAEIVPALVFGLAPLALLGSLNILLVIIAPLIGTWWLRRYFHKWIGGYTGDCLGSIQQVTELLFYLSTIAVWKFI